MQIGPRGEKRPDDPIARAVMIAKISTGEIEEDYAEDEQAPERPRRAARRKAKASEHREAESPPSHHKVVE